MKRYFLIAAWLALSAFTSQPMDERKAQSALPISKHALWDKFFQCKVTVDAKNYTYRIKFTPEVQAMAGKSFTISGFMLPLEAKETFTHFLLSKRTPTCAFCPPGEPNEVIEVFATKPMKWEENLITMSGTMVISDKSDKGLFFQMKDAKWDKK